MVQNVPKKKFSEKIFSSSPLPLKVVVRDLGHAELEKRSHPESLQNYVLFWKIQTGNFFLNFLTTNDRVYWFYKI